MHFTAGLNIHKQQQYNYIYRVCLTISLPGVVQQWVMGHHASTHDPSTHCLLSCSADDLPFPLRSRALNVGRLHARPSLEFSCFLIYSPSITAKR